MISYVAKWFHVNSDGYGTVYNIKDKDISYVKNAKFVNGFIYGVANHVIAAKRMVGKTLYTLYT